MLSESKLRAAIPGLSSVSQSLVLDLEARALAFIEQQTARYFGLPELVMEYVSGNGSRHLKLSEEIRSEWDEDLVLIERSRPGASSSQLDEAAFELRNASNTSYLVRLDDSVWQAGYEYAVTYQRGYACDHGPKDIEQLTVDLIAQRVAGIDNPGVTGETIGGYSYTKGAIYAFTDGDLKSIPGAMRTIAAWTRPVFA